MSSTLSARELLDTSLELSDCYVTLEDSTLQVIAGFGYREVNSHGSVARWGY
ncbi:hypothetical protein [Corynebacterium auriscanis]|uniref:hypothetical protein n=1 Tax=Corynebacterium auriscanis TaxID=99807 RepID=UPI002247E66E|nr:hypothetical protein [Corynebacterium auriscanis]MCX2164036.1 hypothetical protein [Corynebacterium auriscanis]